MVSHNHWNDDGDLVIEEKTLFRQVGWMQGAAFFPLNETPPSATIPFGPIYRQIATWVDGEGWND